MSGAAGSAGIAGPAAVLGLEADQVAAVGARPAAGDREARGRSRRRPRPGRCPAGPAGRTPAPGPSAAPRVRSRSRRGSAQPSPAPVTTVTCPVGPAARMALSIRFRTMPATLLGVGGDDDLVAEQRHGGPRGRAAGPARSRRWRAPQRDRRSVQLDARRRAARRPADRRPARRPGGPRGSAAPPAAGAPRGRAGRAECSSVSAAAWMPASGVRSSCAASARNVRLRSSACRARHFGPFQFVEHLVQRGGGLADLGVGALRAQAGAAPPLGDAVGPGRRPCPGVGAPAVRSPRPGWR